MQMMKSITGAFWLLFFLLPRDTVAISLSQAISMGLAVHPKILAARSDVEQSAIDVDIAKSGYLPALTMSSGPQGAHLQTMGYDITATQMLYDWGRVENLVAEADAMRRMRLAELMVARDDAALDIIEVFFDVLQAEKSVEAVGQYRKALESIHAMAQSRDQHGYSDRSELERTELEILRAQEQLAQEEGKRLEAAEQFQLLVGKPAFGLLFPPSVFSKQELLPPNIDEVIKNAPLFIKSQADVEIAETQLRHARASLLPQLNLEATTQRREIGGRMESDNVMSLRFRMDTIQGLANFQRPAASAQKLQGARWTLNAVSRDIRRQIQSLSEKRKTLIRREHTLTQQIAASSKVIELYREQFEVGHRDIVDLLNVQHERIEGIKQLIALRIEQERIVYRISAQVGKLMQLIGE